MKVKQSVLSQNEVIFDINPNSYTFGIEGAKTIFMKYLIT